MSAPPHDDGAVPFARPSQARLEALYALSAPWRWWTGEPCVLGLDDIPDDRPLMFVGNHTLYGIMDAPFLWWSLYDRCGIYLRPLGDRAHFRIPGWRTVADQFGVVEGSPPACARLFAQGESVLVFPGGAREAAKRRGEERTVTWGKRMGFARLAVRHGVTIVPFSALGVDDQFRIVVDANDVEGRAVGAILDRLHVRQDLRFPVIRGLGPTPIPRPRRLYFSIRAPIATRDLDGRDDDEACWAIRERVRESIQSGIAELERVRSDDPRRTLGRRLVRGVRAAFFDPLG